MTAMRLRHSFLALTGALLLAACEKNAVQDLTGTKPEAELLFYNSAVGAPAVHFYAGDTKLTSTFTGGCTAAANPPVTANDSACVARGVPSTGGIGYGGTSAGTNYTGVPAGPHTITGRITATTDNGLAVFTLPITAEPGKRYSVFQSGIYNTTTKQADGFIVEDVFPAQFDWTTSYVRVVNASSNAPAITVTLTPATGSPVTLASGVAYKSASPFTKVAPGSYTIAVQQDGAASPRFTIPNTGFQPGFVYTLSLRGDWTVTSTTASTRPILDNIRNR